MGVTKVDMNEVKRMRENGLTYSDIGNHFGCSRQRVHEFLNPKSSAKKENFNKFIYKNILSWCKDNEIYSIKKLASVLNMDCTDRTLSNKLEGRNDFTLPEIQKILKATGMDFDFCFSTTTN